MLKNYIFLFIILLSTVDVFSQQLVVRGNVKDELSQSLYGATVAEIDENNRIVAGSITDINGNYVLPISSSTSKIQFSFIGYKTITESINGRKTIDVQILPDAAILEGVEIVAESVGTSLSGISDRNRAGSVAKLDMNTMNDEALTSASDALQGQIAGLDILASGTPGGSANIVIRGLSTLGDATPLIVIDGIAQQSYGDFDYSSADVEDLSALLSVPTQDIKAIRVLKDATECAIWGSQGANGVIEIDTHQGKKGKTKLTYSYKYTYNEDPPQIPLLSGDEYIMLQQEMLFNKDGLSVFPDEISYDPNYVDFYNYSQNTNWYEEISQQSYVKDHMIKIEGGGDKTSYYVSVNVYEEEGQIKNESLDRISSRVNLRYDISNKISLTTRFTYLRSLKGGNWGNNKVSSIAYTKAPNMSVYEMDQQGNLTGEFFNPVTNYQGSGLTYFNPVAVVNYSKNDLFTNQLTSDFILRFDINRFFTFTETISLFNRGNKTNTVLPYNAIGAAWDNANNNSTTEINTLNNSMTSRSILAFRLPGLGDHSLESSLMFETNSNNSHAVTTKGQLNMSHSISDPAANAIVGSVNSSDSKVNTLGALGSLAYNYKSKYLLTMYLRADASSRFGINNRWGYFPSIGSKWRLGEEEFMKRISFIGRGEFSLSWGRTGNITKRLGAYSRHGIYSDGNTYLGEKSIIPEQIQLDDLKWENKSEVSSSLDLGFFNRNKVTLLLEYYNKTTTDVGWSNYPIPSSTGYSTLASYNGGIIRNVGFEMSSVLRDVVKTKDFSVLLRFNINRNRNWFEELPANQPLESNGAALSNLTYPLKTQLGKPVGSIFGVRYLGVYSTDADAVATNADGTTKVDVNGKPIPMVFNNKTRFRGGDAKYDDINHDGVIDINDAVYLGDSNPKLMGGFGGTAKYKQFSLSANFIFRYDFNIVNQIAMQTESMNSRDNQSKATLYRWRKQGDNFEGMIPRAYEGHEFNSLGSDRYVEDGSFLKFNSLALSYTMDNKLKKKLKLNDVRFSANVRKLYTWTNYSGKNPEVATAMSDQFWYAKDSGYASPPRVYSFTISVTL